MDQRHHLAVRAIPGRQRFSPPQWRPGENGPRIELVDARVLDHESFSTPRGRDLRQRSLLMSGEVGEQVAHRPAADGVGTKKH